jgi:hypothetical protein
MRRLALLLLILPAGLAVGAFAMERLGTRSSERALRLWISPARQAVAPGQAAAFSVAVRRSRGPVSLRISGLPRGVKATLRLSNGTPARVVPAGQDAAILTLTASRTAEPHSVRAVVEARSGGQTRRRAALLTVVGSASRLLRLDARPNRDTVLPGETATYRVDGEQRRRRPLRVRIRGLPRDVGASWSPPLPLRNEARLRLRVGRGAEPGAHHLLLVAARRRPRRDEVIVLNVIRGREFGIRGDLGPPLYPGRTEPLELTITNPNDFAIEVTELDVAIRPGTSNPDCGSENYVVDQYRGPYPLRIAPGATRLGELVPDRSLWPRVSMLNLPTNQDACKNARVTLEYRGAARR